MASYSVRSRIARRGWVKMLSSETASPAAKVTSPSVQGRWKAAAVTIPAAAFDAEVQEVRRQAAPSLLPCGALPEDLLGPEELGPALVRRRFRQVLQRVRPVRGDEGIDQQASEAEGRRRAAHEHVLARIPGPGPAGRPEKPSSGFVSFQWAPARLHWTTVPAE